ncbi:MAG: insulinase family protein [Phycisphaeraceae bacterium]|nr:insulinase family protein [Phycisphaerales bacterium]MCB9844130.1 insulinase family protein [Phycisphaeraceae bacterium]
MRHRLLACIAIVAAAVSSARAQQVQPEIFTLDNGMKFLLYPRTEQPNIIAAGWVAKVGSANERPGITGISHFFEHMMFKGTNTIGTSDPARDAQFRSEQDRLRRELLTLQLSEQYQRYKDGEITDPWDPAQDTEQMRAIRAQLDQSIQAEREVTVKNEFDRVYTSEGASGMNAFTNNDMTFYFINVPSNKLELWAWMESDRLYDSVFREFYAERDVVHEERRMRTESTPTGIFQEQFESMFWMSHPYNWPVIGWPSDLNSYTMEDAQNYFDTYYRPNNIVGVIVGDFDPAQAKSLINTYFGRLERGPEPPKVVTLEHKQQAEMRMNAECDCQPQVEVRYHTVPFGHADEAALTVMSELLNGRTGRLYKNLVEGKEIASSAFAQNNNMKYAGYFAFSAETKGDAAPIDLERAWYEELKKLQNELVSDRELQKVKNQSAADVYRSLQNNFFIMLQLGYYEAQGGWEYINNMPRAIQAVTADDVQRVANAYFSETNRAVATFNRKAGSTEDPDFAAMKAALPAEMAAMAPMIKQQIESQLASASLDELMQAQAETQAQMAQMPAEMKPVMEFALKKIAQRIAELKAAENN